MRNSSRRWLAPASARSNERRRPSGAALRPACVGPSFRAVYDLADLDGNQVALATGQSDHLGSPHYDDFIGPWRRGELVPLVLSRARVEELAESRLVLAPSPE